MPRATTAGDAGADDWHDRWRCRWCQTYTHPVATMVSDHEETCVARPVRGVA